MINIRKGLYETNSSSVHALVIPKETTINIPETVNLSYGEWGWDFDREYDTLNYFFTACCEYGRAQEFIDYLYEKGVKNVKVGSISYEQSGNYGIDHPEDLPVMYLLSNHDLLDKLIFSDDSFVDTGNDNSDNCPDAENYDSDKYDVFIKSN